MNSHEQQAPQTHKFRTTVYSQEEVPLWRTCEVCGKTRDNPVHVEPSAEPQPARIEKQLPPPVAEEHKRRLKLEAAEPASPAPPQFDPAFEKFWREPRIHCYAENKDFAFAVWSAALSLTGDNLAEALENHLSVYGDQKCDCRFHRALRQRPELPPETFQFQEDANMMESELRSYVAGLHIAMAALRESHAQLVAAAWILTSWTTEAVKAADCHTDYKKAHDEMMVVLLGGLRETRQAALNEAAGVVTKLYESRKAKTISRAIRALGEGK